MNRRPVIAMAVAAVVSVSVVGAIWLFGIIPTPTFTSLADRPDPAVKGTIAFLRHVEGSDVTCIATVPAGGGPIRDLDCSETSYRDFQFDDAGRVLVRDSSASDSDGDVGFDVATAYDPTTGAVVGRRIPYMAEEPPSSFPGDRFVRTEGCDDDEPGVALVRGDSVDKLVLFETRAPRDYCFQEIVSSPQGSHYAAVDSDGRVLIGWLDEPGLRQLADGADPYEALVWSTG